MARWTAGQDAQLKALYAEGNSCSVIGALLGKSRNAIIGRVHRLKLPRRGAGAHAAIEAGSRPKAAPRAKAKPRARIIRPSREQIAERVAAIVPLHLDLLEMDLCQCKWPFGTGPYTFCGHKVVHQSYCLDHFFLSKAPSVADTSKVREAV